MITFKEYLQEMTNASKMTSFHKMGYLDGVLGKSKIDAGSHQKEYDAAFRLGRIHSSKLTKSQLKDKYITNTLMENHMSEINEMSKDTISSAKDQIVKRIQAKLKSGNIKSAAKDAQFVDKADKKLKEDTDLNENILERLRSTMASIIKEKS